MHRVLFVCVENANRSQMAEAFACMHGAGRIEAASAGSQPSGLVSPRAIAAMAERGYDLGRHESKGLDGLSAERWDYLVTMGRGDGCPFIPAAARDDWDLPDPKDLSHAAFIALRDEIEARVIRLLATLSSQTASGE